jgi:hypothetical protein
MLVMGTQLVVELATLEVAAGDVAGLMEEL